MRQEAPSRRVEVAPALFMISPLAFEGESINFNLPAGSSILLEIIDPRERRQSRGSGVYPPLSGALRLIGAKLVH